jgi:hypothetical protein
MKTPSSLAKWGVAVLLMTSLSSCEDILEQYFPKPNPTPPTIPTFPPLGQDIAFYALSGGTRLDAYNTSNAATRTSSVTITGLASGETLLAIDFRPATGQLYGVSSASRLYVINQNTGVARAIGAGAFTPAVAGTLVGFDFNPTVDRIRVVTSTGQNLRLNPETGAVAATDGVLNGAAGATITGAAYSNNTNGVSTTVLYDLDPATDRLYRQDPPNAGTLVSVGNLNLDISGDGGFDIDAKTGTALGLYTVSGKPTLFAVDLTTGAARSLAQYDAGLNYSGIAIPTQPVAYAVTFAGGNLLIFNPDIPANVVSKPIQGLDATDRVLGLDFRPSTNQLYALVGKSQTDDRGFSQRTFERLYTINPATGEATLATTLSVLGSGSSGGFDFNPVTDQLRLIKGNTENWRVNPDNGVVTQDALLNPGTPFITAAAYSNNFAGATSTTLFDIGGASLFTTSNLQLWRQDPPNAGTITSIGSLGVDGAGGTYHFDIGGTSNTGYALLYELPRNGATTGPTKLYTINLATGAATLLGEVPIISTVNLGGIPSGFTVGLGF